MGTETKPKVMRDALIDKIYEKMGENEKIFFISADFGSPSLDQLRAKYKDRFINVGIAEQNLINISTGLALEGYIVYAYLIAPFLMRAYEQIRINLAMLSQIRPLNLNIIAVGVGLSYDVTGPTHHCLEDISIMRCLPNVMFFSPSDHLLTERFIDASIEINKPKYIRLDGKSLNQIYNQTQLFDFKKGFCEIKRGKELCFVSTGYMTHKALAAAEKLKLMGVDVGVIDLFMLKDLDEEALASLLKTYNGVISLEEGFKNKGGLDALVSNIMRDHKLPQKQMNLGFADEYTFAVGNREYLHQLNKLGIDEIVPSAVEMARGNNLS
ncbi:MAG: transketolase C-terminal domain-containing protein [bacterium]